MGSWDHGIVGSLDRWISPSWDHDCSCAVTQQGLEQLACRFAVPVNGSQGAGCPELMPYWQGLGQLTTQGPGARTCGSIPITMGACSLALLQDDVCLHCYPVVNLTAQGSQYSLMCGTLLCKAVGQRQPLQALARSANCMTAICCWCMQCSPARTVQPCTCMLACDANLGQLELWQGCDIGTVMLPFLTPSNSVLQGPNF